MRFSDLHIRSFRNISHGKLELSPRINVFMGRNGQGKTSVLEALYVLAGFRSFRGARNRELVKLGSEAASIEADVTADDIERRVKVTIESASKRYFIDGKEPGSLAEWIGRLVVVTFSPDDLFLVKGEPELRRRWLDRVIFLLRPQHLSQVMGYQKALKARNALLKDGLYGRDQLLLDSFDETLAKLGAAVVGERRRWVSELAPLIAAEFASLTSNERVCDARLVSSFEGETPDEYLAKLVGQRSDDIRRRKTSFGAHQDDLELTQNGGGARKLASQGEQRALTLAMKLAEVALLERERSVSPVLLLDDVAGELDRERNVLLYRQLERAEGQVFIAGTDLAAGVLQRLEPGAVFTVENGQFSKQN